ncbi:hypothetical protein cypCar_00044064 [Cyprinus carpio]|nr:hypothetical protein cypCar_00044064 [Cyprinus carpio]
MMVSCSELVIGAPGLCQVLTLCSAGEDLPPPVPERTAESFLMATDVKPPPAEASSDEPSSQVRRSVQKCLFLLERVFDVRLFSSQTSADTQTPASPPKTEAEQKNGKGPDSPLSVPKDRRAETEIGFSSRCSHPKGPREPPSEWT